MKKHYFLNGLLIASMATILLLMNACSTPAYKRTVPADAVSVVELDVKNIAQKADFMDQKDQIADLIASVEPGNRLYRKFADAVKNPTNAGLNLAKPVYLFALPSLEDAFITAAVKDDEALIQMLISLSDEFDVLQSGELTWITYNNKLFGVITKNVLLLSTTGTTKEKSVFRDLLTQKEEDSFFSTREFHAMRLHRGDVTMLVNMRALSNNSKRDIRKELENEFGVDDMEDIWNDIRETHVLANLICESGKISMNLFAGGMDDLSSKVLAKKLDTEALKKIPNRNLAGIMAFSIDGKACWEEIDKELNPSKRKMSHRERNRYEAIGEYVLQLNGTVVGSIGGNKLFKNPEVLCVLPAPKAETKSTLNALGERLPEDVYMDGNNTHTAITNMINYDYSSVPTPFDKASAANATYAYAYLKAEPFISDLFDDLTRNAKRGELKVYNQLRDLCELADYAELKVEDGDMLQLFIARAHESMDVKGEGKNKVSLTLYLNDNSNNALSLILKKGIALGNTVVEYENEK